MSSQRWSYTKEALSARHMEEEEEEEEKRIEGAQNNIATVPSSLDPSDRLACACSGPTYSRG